MDRKGQNEKAVYTKRKGINRLGSNQRVKTVSQIASENQIHPVAVGMWKKQLLEGLPKVFTEKQERDDKQKTIDELYRLVGQRDAELSWLKKKLEPFNTP